jgi:aspartate racemase
VSETIGTGSDEIERKLAGLSPEKRALLERRLLAKRSATEEPPGIQPRGDGDVAPLSFLQELMWLLHELSPGMHTYNSSGARRIRGPLDVDALQCALDGVTARHESLRTTFDVRESGPVQVIHGDLRCPLEQIDAPGADGAELDELVRERVRRPFDLREGPLVRATVIRLGDDEHVLVVSANHIVWDGWSKGIYFRELAEIYDAALTGREPQLPELAIQYADFAVWQKEWLSGERLEGQIDFWKKALAGAPPLLDLPTDHPRPAVQTHRGDRSELLWISEESTRRFKALSQQLSASPFMVLVGIWATLLQRYTGQEDIVLGTPVAGRNRVEVEGVIGYFNNTLALRVPFGGDPTFQELVARVREVALGAYSNQDVSFGEVVRVVAPQRDLSYSPVFQSLIVLHNATSESLSLTGVTMDIVDTETGSAKFDLSLGMGEYQGRLHASFEYNTDLFEAETVARVRAQFARLLDQIVDHPQRPLSELRLLSAGEEADLAVAARGPQTEIPAATLHGLFRERARATPDAAAVVAGPRTLTYAQLDARSDAVAAALQERGVGAGAHVGLYFDRSPELIAALLGVLKAGAVCLPLDLEYPAERLAFMVADAGADTVLTRAALRDRTAGLGVAAVAVDELPDAPAPEDVAAPGDVAYLIYTSGSTGRPKGVLLEHRGLVNHALATIEACDFGPADRVLQFASISFDISIEEIYCSLLSGATLVLRSAEMPLGGRGLIDWLERESVTVLDLPTAFWHEWVRDLQDGDLAPPDCLRLVIVGGEKASAELYGAWRRVAGERVRWVNTYGPTEGSVVATAFEPPAGWGHEGGRELPIGWPLPNVSVHVLDDHGRPVPPGVRGELCIGGAGVARGYLNRDAATAEKFVTLDGAGGERVYRTGDRVRRLADGELEFVGRTDDQIKLRGFRIEPGEIEAVLAEHPRVGGAVALVRDDVLLAYAVVDAPELCGVGAELRRFLAERLPGFAVPSAVVPVGHFPVTPNGKVDRDALPDPPTAELQEGAEPRDDLERSLVAIWSELLGHEVGVDDNFFEIGGHSMLAVRMFTLLEKRARIRVPLAAMIQAPTVARLADVIRHEHDDDAEWDVIVPLKASGTRPPLWLVHELDGELLCYRDLIPHFAPDQPAFGLRAAGKDGRTVPNTEIPAMAARYVEEITAQQPEGPYLVGGLCFGGAVAYEIAHQLERNGQKVAFVGLMDVVPWGRDPTENVAQLGAKNARTLATLTRDELRPFLVKKWRHVYRRVRSVVRWQLARRLYLDRGRATPAWLADMQALNRRAAHRYVTPEYGGRVTLFRAQGDRAEQEEDRRLRWSEVAHGGVDVRDVTSQDVTHLTMLLEPHVGQLAGEMEAAIAASLNGGGS